MRPNKIKQMWRAGKCATLGWLSVSHGFTAEVMARQGFDALCVDLQHGTAEMKDVLAHAAGDLADRHGPGRAGRVERAGDHHEGPGPRRLRHHRAAGQYRRGSGDGGGRVPLSARRHALVGPVRAVHYGGADYVANANDEIVVMAMIETKEGLANLDAICATPGLDAVYIGPADLSFALGSGAARR